MIKSKKWIRSYKNSYKNTNEKERIENMIKEMFSKNRVVISKAQTITEICSVTNYNRSVQSPYCVTGKSKLHSL